MDLSERKQRILIAIIEQYIRTDEPVGSKALTELLGNAVSSATIRNDMAELAAMGYLEQPHTSAGRVPTTAALRLYIDRLMPRRPLSETDRRAIDASLAQAADDPARLMEEASQTLAEATGCAAVTTPPSGQDACVRRVDILRVSARSVAILLLTTTGLLRSRLCRLGGDLDDTALARLADILSQRFGGSTLADIHLPQVQGLMVALGSDGLSYAPLLIAFHELVQDAVQTDVLLSGQLNLLQYPDFTPARARELMQLLAQREWLTSVLAALPGGLRVVLGDESARPELSGSSLIVTRYAPVHAAGDEAQQEGGSIGLIGPLRMNYADAISRLEYVAGAIGRLLGELLEEG